ncbi:MAG: GNAT family N-acetyltransferase [Caldilinea sp.]|nr:GNAT family N-acetyltransferase [Caldilinea sp.]MDW8440120.1 GNAT family N-acetyltransferase [Caldilineaceae bacterium]
MTNADHSPQLRMIWPQRRLHAPPDAPLPPGYVLRTYRPGDEVPFFQIMARAGWPDWDEERLHPWLPRIVPRGWFLVVHEATGAVVASAMALRDEQEFGSQGGELGWVVCDPAHRGKGLGAAVSAAATLRLLEEGYRHLHLYTEEWRFAALRTYLRLGYVPLLYASDMPERWRLVCTAVRWPFTPEVWEADLESLQSSSRSS